MKIAILTTETLHHAYFARELKRAHGDVLAFCETRAGTAPPFQTHHAFEDERNTREAARWFGGDAPAISTFVPSRNFSSMNDADALAALVAARPDLVIVFGTGVLRPPLCEAFAGRIFNLHGGNPEEYRGLDTHLWAIYHRDFSNLVTCLHRLAPGLDTGDIVAIGALPLAKDMPLSDLRAVNSEVCVRLTLDALDRFAAGSLTARQQGCAGRYYSAMPAVLKDICVRRFQTHTAKLT